MRTRTLLPALLTTLATAIVATVGAAPAFGAPDTVYCLNGVSTTLPATIGASSVSAGSNTVSFTEAYALDAISLGGGIFYYGYVTGGGWFLSRAPGVPYAPSAFESGYSTNQVGLGACAATSPGVTHVGVCKLLERADGTTGLFQHIAVADWNDAEGPYFDAPAASWVEGLGLTCDDPVGLGYKATGTKVAWGGQPDPNHDPRGVRGSGFNDIYPLFTAS